MDLRTAVTHFDGDPVTINYWLKLYEKYWRGEVDRVIATVCFNKTLNESMREFVKSLFEPFPEIEVDFEGAHIPEIANMNSLSKVTEGNVFLVESDGFVFGRGLVDQCFRLLENEGQDIVCPPWPLITKELAAAKEFKTQGYMRCFFFTKRSVLDKIDVDFMPKTLNKDYGGTFDLDCFGWVSWQLAGLDLKVTTVPSNVMTPDAILEPANFTQWKWLHIRQMSSSGIGMGGGEYELWLKGGRELLGKIALHFNGGAPNPASTFTYSKAVAFRLLMLESFPLNQQTKEFVRSYSTMLYLIMDICQLPKEFIYEVKGFYKGIINI